MAKNRICVVQTNSCPGDREYNISRAESFISEAASNGAALIVLPELFISGYTADHKMLMGNGRKTSSAESGFGSPDDQAARAGLAEPADGPSYERMAALARRYGVHIVYGFPELCIEENDGGEGDYPEPERLPDMVVYNSANLIASDGALIGTYRKTHLFGDERTAFKAGTYEGYFRESIALEPGTHRGKKINTDTKSMVPAAAYPVFDTALGRIGIMICYDIEFPEPARFLAMNGAELIVAISANMRPYDKVHDMCLPVRALENSVFVAYSNYVGSDGQFEYCGLSDIFAPDGSRISFTDNGAEKGAPDDPDAAVTFECESNMTAETVRYDQGGEDKLLYADIDLKKANADDPELDYIHNMPEAEAAMYLR